MTAQILSNELNNIVSESKRKNNDLRNAAEKSIQELKAITVTSEAQLSADLRRRPHFAAPFVLAAKSGNTKLALYAVTSFQRLVSIRGLPDERLKDVLECLQDSCKTGLDVQLKILQCLTQLLQLYGNALEGDLQALVLQICSTLQQIKSAAISSTASATFQQIVTLLFEKVEQEDDKADEIPGVAELRLDAGTCFVRPAAYDAYRVIQDICFLAEGQKPRFIVNASLSQAFGLSLLEALLNNHGELFATHPELAHILQIQLMPLVTRILSERLSFSIAVKTCRILCILLREHLDTVSVECEIPLSLLHHSLESDSSSPWKRALTMEVYRLIYSTPNLALRLYNMLDEQNGRGNVIQDSLGTFVRLAAEKPSLIGSGPQSTFPSGGASRSATADRAMLDASSVAGIITTGELAVAETAAPGISAQWSTLKTPCLDYLDKAEPPTIPETYTYSLVLTCLNGLSENMARIVLPLMANGSITTQETKSALESVVDDTPDNSYNNESGDRVTPVQESTGARSSSEQAIHPSVRTISHLLDSCWPAILAVSSTFLYAALDADFYRLLIRSFQRFTQVAGLLRLSTPRDAFLTTLAKAAVPANVVKADSTPSGSAMTSPRVGSNSSAFASVESFLTQAPAESPTINKQQYFETTLPTLSQRNLMCLRALINLGIALGSILESSWNIILQNLQRADSILAQSMSSIGTSAGRQTADAGLGQTSLGSEVTALEAAIDRMFQSTTGYTEDSFLVFLAALCRLLPSDRLSDSVTPPGTPTRAQRPLQINIQNNSTTSALRNMQFTIAKIGDIARLNSHRLAQETENIAWHTIVESLTRLSISSEYDNTSRLMAANVLGSIIVGVVVVVSNEQDAVRSAVQVRALECLKLQIAQMYKLLAIEAAQPNSADLDVHRSALEALRAILEQCGDSLIAGWRSIFSVIRSAFHDQGYAVQGRRRIDARNSAKPISAKISRSAFASLQLICSDFLPALRKSRVVDLVEIMSSFCSEHIDLNISLTTITLFWEVSDFLRVGMTDQDASKIVAESAQDIEAQSFKMADDGSLTATWLILLCRLAAATGDDRQEIRSGAVQTIFRILDACGDSLSPKLWELCFHGALLEILQINSQAYQPAPGQDLSQAALSALKNTSGVVLAGLATTIARNLTVIREMPQFETIWSTLHTRLAELLAIRSSTLAESLFRSFATFLSGVTDKSMLTKASLGITFDLWTNNAPIARNEGSNEKAIVAYLDALKELHRLTTPDLSTMLVKNVIHNLQSCATGLVPGAYTTDVDNMTEAQAQILICLGMLDIGLPEVTSTFITTISEFITLPYKHIDQAGKQDLSYIAFSKTSTALLEKTIMRYTKQKEVFTSGAAREALAALAHCIKLKYTSTKQGKSPYVWASATSTAITILEQLLSASREFDLESDILEGLYNVAVDISIAIASADLSSPPDNKQLLDDETFDLTALQSVLRYLVTYSLNQESPARSSTWLGSATLPEELRQRLFTALAWTSLIHEPASAIPSSNTIDNTPSPHPLSLVTKIRPGRTYNPSFSPRLRMCYFCLDQLVNIVDTSSNSNTHATGAASTGLTLARTAFPYLVLRLAIPMQRYIADQPLRGRMPTPQSQRLELLYALRKAKELRCTIDMGFPSTKIRGRLDADTIEEGKRATGSINSDKQHLEWLAPLASKLGRLARHDREIADACAGVMEVALLG